MGQRPATRQTDPFFQWMEFKGWQHGRERLRKKMRSHGVEVLCRTVHRNPRELAIVHGHEKIGEPDDVIEMRVRQKDTKFARRQSSRDTKERRAGVEGDPHVGQQDARRVSSFAGVITPCSEEVNVHE